MNIREHEHDYYFLRTAARRSMAWDVQNLLRERMNFDNNLEFVIGPMYRHLRTDKLFREETNNCEFRNVSKECSN